MEPKMPILNWSDTPVLNFAPLDDMHREFVTLLADVEARPDNELITRWDELVRRDTESTPTRTGMKGKP